MSDLVSRLQRLESYPKAGSRSEERRKTMEKLLKSKYEEPKLEIAMLATDIITTSGVEDVGSDKNVDDGGWTNGSTNW